MGSYAAYRVGQWEAFGGAEGEQEENVYFCGEHTSIDYQGYMNGAAETGRSVAEAIAGVC
jgi:monoamine oxidase